MRSSLLYPALFLTCMLPFSSAWAERNYGAAGCGVGSVFVKKEDSQLLAAGINFMAPSVSAATVVYMIAGGQPLAVAMLEAGGRRATAVAVIVGAHPAIAMSLGTSNCKPDAQELAVATEQERFMFVNYASLSREVAQGDGTHLSTLLELFGCPSSQQESLRKVAQAEHERIFAAPGAVAALDTMRETLAKHADLAQGCKNIAVPPSKGATR
ncbi:MAG: DUF3015 domain-containing protein [Betaproteobacteria bacterium]|nr:DUF3015 domain-containing protein [Betaproteobacteria bacterium]